MHIIIVRLDIPPPAEKYYIFFVHTAAFRRTADFFSPTYFFVISVDSPKYNLVFKNGALVLQRVRFFFVINWRYLSCSMVRGPPLQS